MPEKIRVDMDELTLDEMADVAELLVDTFGQSLNDLLSSPKQPLAIAALAWAMQKRTNPDYTFAEARRLRIGDIDFVAGGEAQPGEALGVSNGAVPPPSPVSGDSIQVT